MTYRRLASLKTPDEFLAYAAQQGASLPFDDELDAGPESPLAAPLMVADRTVGNRFAILPMEGWDGTPEGGPTDLTRRRWQRFGQSGAKLIWGGEAVAVAHNGRANPHQLWLHDDTQPAIAALREELIAHHQDQFGQTDDLLVGLQLTHSGRFARPNQKDRLEPLVMYRHPLLEERFGTAATQHVLSDDEIREIIGQFIEAAVRSADMGYDFVDIKHCHGYLGHEMLSAWWAR